ncbi:MAG: response regulator [Lachnospiraceae bacterium]|jgi:two-component system response regulator YesN|nr:response regulator [Lachnospiraceae bacterium]
MKNAIGGNAGEVMMRILIVEDEIRIREGIVKLLTKLDPSYEVVGEAIDGTQGLQMCEETQPDLVITDIRMPNMDGLEMLSAIYSRNMNPKAIVLSAYSEFEYARGAMKMGVTEYLLKPVSLMEFSRAMENVAEQIAADKKKKPAQVGTLEQIFSDVIFRHKEVSEETADYLENAYGIRPEGHFFLLCAYLGNAFETKREEGFKFLRHAFMGYGELSYILLESAYHKSIVMLMYHYKDGHDIERFIQYQLLQQVGSDLVVGCEEKHGFKELSTGLVNLFPYMDWNISFEKDILISYPKITNVQTALCIYPIEIETAMKSAIFEKNEEKIKKVLAKFHKAFLDGRIYSPREVKECYVRFLWTILEIGKEAGCRKEGQVQRQKLLDRIMNAKSHQELNDICDEMISSFDFTEKSTNASHLMVRKAESLMREFYNTGITLEEIAGKLNITPEYLGTQFHKETGLTYSAYMKNYRMSKAKELLISTNLKLYEIADQVGYQDPKYFSKVFRDNTGMLPAEYRRTIK